MDERGLPRSQYQWDCAQAAIENVWTRYTEMGETDLEAIVTEEVEFARPAWTIATPTKFTVCDRRGDASRVAP